MYGTRWHNTPSFPYNNVMLGMKLMEGRDFKWLISSLIIVVCSIMLQTTPGESSRAMYVGTYLIMHEYEYAVASWDRKQDRSVS